MDRLSTGQGPSESRPTAPQSQPHAQSRYYARSQMPEPQPRNVQPPYAIPQQANPTPQGQSQQAIQAYHQQPPLYQPLVYPDTQSQYQQTAFAWQNRSTSSLPTSTPLSVPPVTSSGQAIPASSPSLKLAPWQPSPMVRPKSTLTVSPHNSGTQRVSLTPNSIAPGTEITPDDVELSRTRLNPFFVDYVSSTQGDEAPFWTEKPGTQSTASQSTLYPEKTIERSHSAPYPSSPPPPYAPPSPPQSSQYQNMATLMSSLSGLLSNLRLGAPEPTPDNCIAHLKLLECFFTLKEKVANTDGVFGLSDSLILKDGDWNSTEQEKAMDLLREKRWAVYVARAVDRFELWWKNCTPSTRNGVPSEKLKIADLGISVFEESFRNRFRTQFTADKLPPLDVLMVWHAYMLNPRAFAEDCLRFGKLDFWAQGMPWEAVNAVVDSNSFEYNPPRTAIQSYERKTERAWSNLDDGDFKKLVCLKCDAVNQVPWNTSHTQEARNHTDDLSSRLSEGEGYAEAGFKYRCNCSNLFNHPYLQYIKFMDDVEALGTSNHVMPGSFLSNKGIPEKLNLTCGSSIIVRFNELVTKYVAKLVLAVGKHGNAGDGLGLDKVKGVMNDAIKKARIDLIKEKGMAASLRLSLFQLITVRRVMSRYWGNSSSFALDLVGAVIRQGEFIRKMHNIDWLHAPPANAIMRRLIVKYGRFFSLFGAYPRKTIVPTLDVDLAWHTHQLSPPDYYEYSMKMTKNKVFIDHDDKIDESKLNTAFEFTCKVYEKKYGEVYSECACWYCAAVRQAHSPSGISRLFGRGKLAGSGADSLPSDPERTPHISSHGAVRSSQPESKRRELEDRLKILSQSAQKKSNKKKALAGGALGVGLGVAAFEAAPYRGVGYVPGYYASNPACVAVTGDSGACANNPGLSTVAAGAFAGSVTGACIGGGGTAACQGGVSTCGGGDGAGGGGVGGGCGGGGTCGGSACGGSGCGGASG